MPSLPALPVGVGVRFLYCLTIDCAFSRLQFNSFAFFLVVIQSPTICPLCPGMVHVVLAKTVSVDCKAATSASASYDVPRYSFSISFSRSPSMVFAELRSSSMSGSIASL